MTFAAVFERQVAAKRLPAVVTAQTRRAARGDEVLCGRGRADLTGLWGTCCEAVTVRTCEAFARAVVGMTERVAIRTRVGAGGAVGFLLVTNSARRHLAA